MTALILLAVLAALLTGVGVVASFASLASEARWGVWGSVGESFGALNTIFSGLALAALVVTFWLQFKELRSQRAELALQRQSLMRSHGELHRAAEANIRHRHVGLMSMAVEDPVLAEVWPPAHTGLPPDRLKQYFYANLVLQHIRLNVRIGTDEEMENQIRYVFASPIMRLFRMDTAAGRADLLVPGTEEHRFWHLATAVCNEYESVLAKARGHRESSAAGGPSVAEAA